MTPNPHPTGTPEPSPREEPSSIEDAARKLCEANYAFHTHTEPGTRHWVKGRLELEQAWRDLQALISAADALAEVDQGAPLHSFDEVFTASPETPANALREGKPCFALRNDPLDGSLDDVVVREAADVSGRVPEHIDWDERDTASNEEDTRLRGGTIEQGKLSFGVTDEMMSESELWMACYFDNGEESRAIKTASDRLRFWADVLIREAGLEHRDNDEQVEVAGRVLHNLTQSIDAALEEAKSTLDAREASKKVVIRLRAEIEDLKHRPNTTLRYGTESREPDEPESAEQSLQEALDVIEDYRSGSPKGKHRRGPDFEAGQLLAKHGRL